MTDRDGEPDDRTLVGRIASGDEAAFELVYDRHGGLLFGSLVRFLGDREVAAEVVQDAFLALWRTAPRFVPEHGRASTWILTLVHRRAVDGDQAVEKARREFGRHQ